MTQPPAGWYPAPDNREEQRYWDGSEWLNIPPPPTSSTTGTGRRKMKRGTLVAILATASIIVLGAGGGIAWKVISDQQEAEAAAAAAELQAEKEAAAEAQRIQEEEIAESVERDFRKAMVSSIEESVKKMAEEHVSTGLLDGPIIEVSCSPVNGGSTDNLDEATTVFECFAANKDNEDGTMSGYTYSSTMNWDSGEYTYSLGSP